MGGSSASGRAARRLLVVTLTVSALSLLWSSPAFAQSLISLPAGGDDAGVDTTTGVAQVAAPAVQVVASVAQQATSPAAETTTPVVQQTVAPVVASAVPTVQGATRAATPLVETATRAAAPVVQTAAPVVQAAITPVLQAAAPIVQATAPVLDPVLERTAPVLGVTSPVISPAASGAVGSSTEPVEAPTTIGSGSADDVAPSTTTDGGRMTQPDRHTTWAAAPSVAGTSGTYSPLSADPPKSSSKGTRATAPRSRWPGLPDAPTTPGSAATAVSGGGASILAAALAAALLLAAPGLSRRLRLRLAPRPLSIPLPSLERPG